MLNSADFQKNKGRKLYEKKFQKSKLEQWDSQ